MKYIKNTAALALMFFMVLTAAAENKITFAQDTVKVANNATDYTDVALKLEQSENISAIQMNITIPDSIICDQQSFALGGAVKDIAELTVKPYNDNKFFVQISYKEQQTSLGTGEILTFKVKAKSNKAILDAIRVTNIIGSTTEAKKIELSNVSTVLREEQEVQIEKIEGTSVEKATVEPQNTTVDTTKGDESIKALDNETKNKISENTGVSGVQLSTQGTRNIVSNLVNAETSESVSAEFKEALKTATSVNVKVDVTATPSNYTAGGGESKSGTITYELKPFATVSIPGTSLSAKTNVGNDMLDQNNAISVKIYTGFEPKLIKHTADNGEVIETFTKEGNNLSYDGNSKTAEVKITHFSSLLASESGLKYTVTCNTAEHGTVTSNAAAAGVEAGTEVTLTTTPAEGYELDALTVKDAGNNTVTVTDNKFTMPGSNVTVTATFKKPLVETTLYTTKFQDWEEVASSTTEVSVSKTTIDKQNLTFSLMETSCNPTDSKFIVAPATTGYLMADKTATPYIKTSTLNNVTTVRFVHAATGSNRGWGLKVKGDGDADWVTLSDAVADPKTGQEVTVDVNRTNVQLWFYNLTSDQNAYMTSLEIKGNASPGDPVDPTATFNNANYTVGQTLDLSTLFTSNSEGAVTYSIKDAGTTGATLAEDGKTFSATAAGTATVTATQAAVDGFYNAITKEATITASEMNYLIRAEFATATTATVTGTMAGATADISLGASGKLDKGKYFGVKAADGETFKAGNVVKVHFTAAGSGKSWYAFNSSTASEENLIFSSETDGNKTDLLFTLTSDQTAIYFARDANGEGDYGKWNPTFGYIQVGKLAIYTVTCNTAEHGTVTSDAAATGVEAGTEVTLTVTPDASYELDALTVKDAGNNAVTVTDNKFTMPASNVTVTATFKAATAINSVDSDASVSPVQGKVFHNGQVVIVKNGKMFTVAGQEIK